MASILLPPRDGPAGKPDFANYADGFANRFATLPGARALIVGSIAGIVVASVAAPFSTASMDMARRLLFWTSTVASIGILWRLWFAWRVRTAADWPMAVWTGLPAVTLVMPLVIAGGLALVGHQLGPRWWWVWIESGIVGLAILLCLLIVDRRRDSPPVAVKGRLFRMGVSDPKMLRRVTSDDHYLRLSLTDGRELMIHGRFADLAGELAQLDGVTVRRGTWIASADVDQILREGRRQLVVTRDGQRVPVSPAGRAGMKLRGWIG